jgi:hypothetical protein
MSSTPVRDRARGGPPEPSDAGRRNVVPAMAGRTLWFAAIWTGVGAAALCATLAIVSVAICWLPSAGASGHSIAAIRAGLLTFLAALHGGVVVDGGSAQFLPLGLTIIVGVVCWRAGSGLADAATDLAEHDTRRLAVAAVLQAASFTALALIAVPFAHLGTSRAPWLGVAAGGMMLFVLSGGVSFVRSGPLRERVLAKVPDSVRLGVRAAAVALAAYVAVAALLVAMALVLHAGRVEEISRQLGGGWSGIPVLVLGVLAAPNAVIAALAYLLGPGFAIGTGATVSVGSAAHGVVPAFPLLGALPHGKANALVWVAVAAAPVLAGLLAARVLWRVPDWQARWRGVAAAAGVFGAALFMLAWQGGGGIGSGRLHVVGASGLRTGAFGAVTLAVAASLGLAAGVLRSHFGRWADFAGAEGQPVARLLTPATSEPMRRLRALTRAPAPPGPETDGPRAEGPRKLAG